MRLLRCKIEKIIKEGLNLLDNLKRLETTYLGPSIRT